MSFWNKTKQEITVKSENEKSLYPVLHVMGSLKDYHTELVQKEVHSLRELSEIGRSFGDVMKEAGDFQNRLEDFGENFASIQDVSGEFVTVKDTIAKSVGHAQDEVEELKNSSRQVETHFSEMGATFEDLQMAVEKIKRCTNKIINIAEQTNILALKRRVRESRERDLLWLR